MSAPLDPGAALFKGEKPFPAIPSCDHYAGSEKLMFRALELHDRATCRGYREVLQQARTIGMPVPAEADRAFFG